MKKLKGILTITLFFALAIMLTGCGKNENGGNDVVGGEKWPNNINYVPNITYDGKGKIVKTKEDTSYGNQYMIYIKGADLKSANDYVDKLYSNGYSVESSFDDEGKYLKQPEKNKSYKMRYVNSSTGYQSDATIIVNIALHDGNDEYDLVITFGDLNS